MNIYEKIHKKRLKRKRMLKGRLECHGSTRSCFRIHPRIVRPPEFVMPLRSEYRPGPWRRFINWLSNIWK